VNEQKATLYLETELKNYAGLPTQIDLIQTLYDTAGAVIATKQQPVSFTDTTTICQQLPNIGNPHLWAPNNPYRYTLVTDVMRKGRLIDRTVIGCGIRRIHWVDPNAAGSHPFNVNGRPIPINGVAEDEHRLGDSHAFTLEEIKARVSQIRAAGFNAFHDAQDPHNLYYQHFWDSIGMLWWPQFSTHTWCDTPEFRKNFKQDLIEFVKERRNSPGIILWGLQNENKLPEDFAKECADIIRRLDPTASSQRPIVTGDGDPKSDSAVHFVDYKDLFTEWGEPLDPYYFYKARFTRKETEPMVYIVRRPQPTITVYSNCDTVELFNGPISLGKHIRHGIGTQFQWDSVKTKYPLLKAVAHDKGQEVAMDETDLAAIRGLTHIDTPVRAPRTGVFGKIESLGRKIRNAVPDILTRNDEVISPDKGYNYLYRVNCGGPTYTDHDKNVWLADTHYTGGNTWGSTTDPIANTVDDSLFRTFRYGLTRLNYTFPVQPGDYRVELYFVEPWLGTGSPKTDCTGWRQFDVAVNDQTVINGLDAWKEAGGRAIALKKVVYVKITGNNLDIHFPKVAAGQGLIAAIAIATKDKNQHPVPPAVGADFQKKGDIYALLNPTYQ